MIDVQRCSRRKQNKSNVGISEGLAREGGDARRGELNLNLRRILTPAAAADLAPSFAPLPLPPLTLLLAIIFVLELAFLKTSCCHGQHYILKANVTFATFNG